MENIGLRIKDLKNRHYKGNNVKMASDLNTSEANIRNYINGKAPKIEFIVNICEKLEINYEWILLGKGSVYRTEGKSHDDYKEKYNFAMKHIEIQNKYISNLEKELSSKKEPVNTEKG